MKAIVGITCSAALMLLMVFCGAAAADRTPEQLVAEARAVIREVSVGDVKRMIDAQKQIILLDVRDRHEFEEGHIPGAINISRGSLEFKVGLVIPDKNADIVVYCGLDVRSPLATKALNDLGYAHAVNMSGGLKGWKEAGFPVAR